MNSSNRKPCLTQRPRLYSLAEFLVLLLSLCTSSVFAAYSLDKTSIMSGNSSWGSSILAMTASLSGSNITFTVSKNGGGSFSSSGTMYLKVGTYESFGVDRGSKSVIANSTTSLSFTHDLNAYSGYPKDFYARYQVSSSTTWAWVGPIKVSSLAVPKPAIPNAPTASATGANSINISWPTVSNAAIYGLWRADSATGTYKQIYCAANPSYSDSGTHLLPTTTYYYKVKAGNSEASCSDGASGGTTGWSDFSGVGSATTQAKAPTGPSVEWTKPVENSQQYGLMVAVEAVVKNDLGIKEIFLLMKDKTGDVKKENSVFYRWHAETLSTEIMTTVNPMSTGFTEKSAVTVSFKVTDKNGQMTEIPSSRTFSWCEKNPCADTELPTGNISGINSTYTVGETVSYQVQGQDNEALSKLSFSVADANNVQKYTHSWEASGTSANNSDSFSTSGWGVGTYYYALWVEDAAHNKKEYTGSFTLSSQLPLEPPPIISSNSPNNISPEYKNGFLGFPLPNKASDDAIITVVLDHSLKDGPYSWNGRDKKIIKYDGVIADLNEIYENGIYSYQTTTGQTLSYDEHPGYDYRTRDQESVKEFSGETGRIPVLAAANGTVDKSNCIGVKNSSFGAIKIVHEYGYATCYLHLRRIDVEVGQKVFKGQQIGIAGGTGPKGKDDFAPHLHFEVTKNGKPVDPYGWTGNYDDPLGKNYYLWDDWASIQTSNKETGDIEITGHLFKNQKVSKIVEDNTETRFTELSGGGIKLNTGVLLSNFGDQPLHIVLSNDKQEVVLDTYYPFMDAKPGQWYTKPAVLLWKEGILEGKNGVFGQGQPTSRAVLLKMALLSSNKTSKADFSKKDTVFSDVNGAHWASGYVQYAEENGIVSVGKDKLFRPDNTITRAEAAKMISKTFKWVPGESIMDMECSITKFTDLSGNEWYYHFIADVCEHGIMKGTVDKDRKPIFNPTKALTREEAAMTICRAYSYEKQDNTDLCE